MSSRLDRTPALAHSSNIQSWMAKLSISKNVVCVRFHCRGFLRQSSQNRPSIRQKLRSSFRQEGRLSLRENHSVSHLLQWKSPWLCITDIRSLRSLLSVFDQAITATLLPRLGYLRRRSSGIGLKDTEISYQRFKYVLTPCNYLHTDIESV